MTTVHNSGSKNGKTLLLSSNERVQIRAQMKVAILNGQAHKRMGHSQVTVAHRMCLAPRPGLEPGTCGLTVRRSTD